MKLHCLGTAGYHPSETRHTSCYFLPESGIVLDAGTGIFRLTNLIQTDHLDILLSHSHLDHIVGLTYLLGILYERPVTRVRVFGIASKLRAIQRYLFSQELFPVKLDVQWMPIESDADFELESGVRVKPFALDHPGGSLGYRIDWPTRSMAYVTDTTARLDASYVQTVRGVNLLLHECNFRSEQDQWAVKTGHSSTQRVGQVAASIGAGQTWLIHLNPLETTNDPVGIADAQSLVPSIQVTSDRQVIEF